MPYSSPPSFSGVILDRSQLPGINSYVTTGVHNTFDLMLSALGRSPTSSFVLCSLFRDALDLPQEAYLDFPRTREWKTAAAHYRTLFAACGIRPQDILLRLPNRRLYIGPHVH